MPNELSKEDRAATANRLWEDYKKHFNERYGPVFEIADQALVEGASPQEAANLFSMLIIPEC